MALERCCARVQTQVQRAQSDLAQAARLAAGQSPRAPKAQAEIPHLKQLIIQAKERQVEHESEHAA